MAASYIPLVEPATAKDLKSISEKLKLGVRDDQIEDYLGFVNKALQSMEGLREMDEVKIPVLYPRVPGYTPSRSENPDNTWASKVTIKGEAIGLLAGKRLAIKDSIFIAGTPLQHGSKIWDGYTPEFDAPVVTRILQSGGTIIGKATSENQGYSGNSFTSATGPISNPHDASRTSGGSSSGSAVLVVKGEVDMALGGDEAGSIRIPACWSGCVGLKPTFSLVPVTGSLGMIPSVEHIGPLATNVTDVATLLEAIAGYDNGTDHRQRQDFIPPKYSQLLKGDLTDKKFGYVLEGFTNATNGVTSEIDKVVSTIRATGATVEKVSIPTHAKGIVLFRSLIAASHNVMAVSNGSSIGHKGYYQVTASKHMKMALQTQAHDLQPTVKASMLLGEFMREKDGHQLVTRALNMIPTLQQAYDAMLKNYDVLIMPTMPTVAPKLPPLGVGITEYLQEALVNVQNTVPFNLTGHPALSLNVGQTKPEDGDKLLPVGLQIVGKHYEDDKVLDMAFGIEKVINNQ